MCPVKIQISLRIRAVWSESSLGIFWIAKDAVSICGQRRLLSDCADAQANLSLRWAHRWEGTFITLWLKYKVYMYMKRVKWKGCPGVYTNSEGPDQPVYPCSLIKLSCFAFVIISTVLKVLNYWRTNRRAGLGVGVGVVWLGWGRMQEEPVRNKKIKKRKKKIQVITLFSSVT